MRASKHWLDSNWNLFEIKVERNIQLKNCFLACRLWMLASLYQHLMKVCQPSKSPSEISTVHRLHGVWMVLVMVALILCSAPASQWASVFTQAFSTSHQVKMVRNGCEVFVVLQHSWSADGMSSEEITRSVHQHLVGDYLLSFLGRTFDTQQDHIIQLPCESSPISVSQAGSDEPVHTTPIQWLSVADHCLAKAPEEVLSSGIEGSGVRDFSQPDYRFFRDTDSTLRNTFLLI